MSKMRREAGKTKETPQDPNISGRPILEVLTRPRFRWSVHDPDGPSIEEVIIDHAEDELRGLSVRRAAEALLYLEGEAGRP